MSVKTIEARLDDYTGNPIPHGELYVRVVDPANESHTADFQKGSNSQHFIKLVKHGYAGWNGSNDPYRLSDETIKTIEALDSTKQDAATKKAVDDLNKTGK